MTNHTNITIRLCLQNYRKYYNNFIQANKKPKIKALKQNKLKDIVKQVKTWIHYETLIIFRQ